MSDQLKLGLIIGSALLVITIVLLLILKNKNQKKNHSEYPGLLAALGGAGNISNVTLNGSRISLNFVSKESLNKELIKSNGVESIVISNKKITLVIGKNSNDVFTYLNTCQNEKEAI